MHVHVSMCPTGGISLSLSLVETAAALRNSSLHSDLQITSKNRSYHAHKFILYSRSRKWGLDSDLSTASVLDWRQWSEETIEDLLDYIYLDQVSFLTDGRYDREMDERTINLFAAASLYSLDQLVDQCDHSLINSKNRYSLPPGSAAVLTTVAFSVKKKNIRSKIKPKSGRSLLRVQSPQVDHDPYHDHNYLGIQKQEKKRKLNHQEEEKADTTDNDEADAVSDQLADNKAELTNGQREAEVSAGASVVPSSDVRPSVPPSSGAGAMVSQAWGGARPKTTRSRPRPSEATASTSSSSTRLRNSESVEIRVLPCDLVNSHQPPSLEQEFPSGSLHSDPLIPRLESLPHISSSASHNPEADTENYVYTYIGGTAFLSADLPDSLFR